MMYFVYGAIARAISSVIKTKKKHWVFGSNMGHTYGDGSSTIMEYVSKNDSSIRCSWITQSKEVFRECKKNGIRCYMNTSVRGMIEIAKADVVFTTHSARDICFSYHKRNRLHVYLGHGPSAKASRCAATLGYYYDLYGIGWRKFSFKDWLGHYLIDGFWEEETDLHFYTSDFVIEQAKSCLPSSVKNVVLGSPRADIMFNEKKKTVPYFDPYKGKLKMVYMPTHRMFGKGNLSPMLFSKDIAKIKWLREHNVVILVKQHPTMLTYDVYDKNRGTLHNDVVIDITKCGLDPLIVMGNADVLISDYSSAWLEFMVLRRPVAHYIYDDFALKDQGIFEDMYKYPGINMFNNEDDLFTFVQKCAKDYDNMRPKDETMDLFHKYKDGNSAQRVYNYIIKQYE